MILIRSRPGGGRKKSAATEKTAVAEKILPRLKKSAAAENFQPRLIFSAAAGFFQPRQFFLSRQIFFCRRRVWNVLKSTFFKGNRFYAVSHFYAAAEHFLPRQKKSAAAEKSAATENVPPRLKNFSRGRNVVYQVRPMAVHRCDVGTQLSATCTA